MLTLKIITPQTVAFEQEGIVSITVPGTEGELTVLPNHAPLFTMLEEGVIQVVGQDDEIFFSIGRGYLETDGKTLNILVSRAYGQDQIDEEEVKQAKERAEKLLEEVDGEHDRQKALQELHRSMIDLKLISKVKRKTPRHIQS